ncbi:uncharacterized protein [Triticum aestivum]|uniref:uncharacterized protein isoform X2 n=1 Tax=Triticum aestivum TaxID=4565 RepID=UPI001D033DB0|nr:uncharacterized protein LOC123186273 isoform X2 [Triticum aestivum]
MGRTGIGVLHRRPGHTTATPRPMRSARGGRCIRGDSGCSPAKPSDERPDPGEVDFMGEPLFPSSSSARSGPAVLLLGVVFLVLREPNVQDFRLSSAALRARAPCTSTTRACQILHKLSRESHDILCRNCNHFYYVLCHNLGIPKLPSKGNNLNYGEDWNYVLMRLLPQTLRQFFRYLRITYSI